MVLGKNTIAGIILCSKVEHVFINIVDNRHRSPV